MPNYSYTNQWFNPQQTIDEIRKKYGRIDSSPVFYGYWSKAAAYTVALADYEEGLHSLITENTCTCGLRLEKSDNLLAIIESKHHRNHKTLEPEPNPKFRGLVGRRIAAPFINGSDIHPVDALWDRIVSATQTAS